MNHDAEAAMEPERYELREGPLYRFEMDRRELFKLMGGGIIVMFAAAPVAAQQESGRGARQGRQEGEAMPAELGAWLHIGADGTVTVYTGKAEIGQNIRTSLTQAVAEELHAPVSAIRLVMGDTALTPFDQGTFGSRTTPTMAPQLRRVAATAREMLLDLAAERWKTDRASLAVSEGKVVSRQRGQSISFGELTEGQKLLKTVGEMPATPAGEWKVAGHPVPKVDGRDFVTGKHRYSPDVKRPGMLYGKVLRPAGFNATLASVDTRKAEAMPGVTVVHDGNFVGVSAPDPATAARAAAAIDAKWDVPQQPSAAELFSYLKSSPSERGGFGGAPYTAGSLEKGMAAAAKKLERSYTVAYIAHAPLEPRAAVAEWNEGKLTVWTGSQRPFGVRTELVQAFRIPQEQVRVIVPDTGAAYGGKHTGDAAIEAARLAKAAGKPVKVVWTREEEFTWAYFRPAGVIEARSGVAADGAITAWEFHNYNSGGAAIRTFYEIPNQHIEFHNTRSPLRQGSYRGLAATANNFAREVHMDELAELAGMEPLAFRLRNITNPRFRAVYEAAAERFGWGKEKPSPQRGFGIGGGFEKGGYVATCAEVAISPDGAVAIKRVVTAFDCGAVVNPDGLKNQIEGANVQGIGGALFEAIDFANGKILNAKFSQYRVPRFRDLPVIETVLVDRKDVPSAGAGETPLIGLAPAVANAIHSATGVRLRSLPLAPDGMKKA